MDKKKRWEMILGKKEDCYYFMEGYWRGYSRLIFFCCRAEWEAIGKARKLPDAYWSRKCTGVCKYFRKR